MSSRHPDNPYWCQNHDLPKAICTRAEWDDAVATGFLTVEHVMLRLKNIADYEFGGETAAGPGVYDAEGFLMSLTSAGVKLEGGITLQVNPNDHPPPHVHVKIKAEPRIKLRVRLDTAEPMDPLPDGWAKKLRGFQTVIRENHAVLAGWWEEYHGEPVSLA